jgi:hypothetical protein
MDPCGLKCTTSYCEEKLDCSWLLTQHTILEPLLLSFWICRSIITLCFGTLLRDWVTCEIWWQTSDMRPMIMSTIGGYYRLHNKHDQTLQIFFTIPFILPCNFQHSISKRTVISNNKLQAQTNFNFLHYDDNGLSFQPITRKCDELWTLYKTFTILSHPLLSHINKFWDHNEQ